MDNEIKSIEFSLQRVSTEQFAIIEEGFEDKGNVQLKTSFRFAVDESNKIVAAFTFFVFESESKPFLMVEAGCHFTIAKDDWYKMYRKETNMVVVPKGFLCHLAMLTVGTSRGILHAKTEGTCFNKYVIPTINVTEVVKEDVSFRFEAN